MKGILIQLRRSNMNFLEAIEKLQAGELIAREIWAASGEYLILLPGMQYIIKAIHQPTSQLTNFFASTMVGDLIATDWKIVEQAAVNAAIAPPEGVEPPVAA